MVVRSETPDPAGADQSLGDLVALATKDASQLLRYEIDLAKTELKSDVKRVGIAAGLAVMAAFVACLVIVLLCIAFGFGLIALGIWPWAAFLIVTGTCILLAALGLGIAYLALTHMSGLRETRKSVAESLGVLRGGDHQLQPQLGAAAERASISRDGQQAEIAAARDPR
jgi:hypothetical protein